MAVQGKLEAVEQLAGIGWVARGWAVDMDTPDEPVRLALTSEKGVLGEFRADLSCPDLAPEGAGRNGFAVKLPGELLDGRPHLIWILVRKDGTALAHDGEEIFFPQDRAPERGVGPGSLIRFSGQSGRDCQAATAGRLTRGSSPSGAIVSRCYGTA